MTDIKRTMQAYDKDIRELVDIKPQQFDIVRIATMVREVPPRKWKAAQAVVDATVKKKQAEQVLRTAKATAMMQARHKPDLPAAPDRTAWVDNQEAVKEAEIGVINTEAELMAAKLAFDCLDDLFSAGKRIMQYLIEQEKATKDYDRYVSEANRNK